MVHLIPRGVERVEILQSLLNKYTAGLLPTAALAPPATGPGHDMYVVLSGSTGSLGSHLLHRLIATPGVIKIYCLNRAKDGYAKQKKSSSQRGLRDQWDPDKVKFIHIDVSQPRFGLDVDTYKLISDDATLFIHLMWPVDFVNSVDAFESHLQGVRNVVDFSVAAAKRPSILFPSSIGAASYWSKQYPEKLVPETPIHDLAVAALGYGESKLVSELFLEKAGQICGTHSTVLRIGHIAGPIGEDGLWNTDEWIPMTIASSKHMGMIPHTFAYLNKVDWTPVDVLSAIVIELIHSETGPLHAAETRNGSCLVYNIVNQKQTTWTDLVPTINSHLRNGKLKEVPFEEWVKNVKNAAIHGESVTRLPAMKFIDFFEIMIEAAEPGDELPIFDTTRACQSSDEMAKLQGISIDNMVRWMDQWGFRQSTS